MLEDSLAYTKIPSASTHCTCMPLLRNIFCSTIIRVNHEETSQNICKHNYNNFLLMLINDHKSSQFYKYKVRDVFREEYRKNFCIYYYYCT